MTDIFVSYARARPAQARQVADALRALGHSVWLDDALPAHRPYSEVIEERLSAAQAVVVVWSAEAARSQWVFSEANRGREDAKLVQVRVDDARLPMPFDTIHCADLTGWNGDPDFPGWRNVVASLGDLTPRAAAPPQIAPTAPPLPDKPSIVVMPFANLSGDPEQDYFAEGMVEELTAALSRFTSIFVIASSSARAFKGQDVGPAEAAARLGVEYVLEGSVRKAGGRVRIALKLVEAASGAQIWANRFEDTLEDVFALQDRIALGVASTIVRGMGVAQERRAATRPTSDMGSYDLYLRAGAILNAGAGETAEWSAALDLLHRAIDLDPDFALALSMAAGLHAVLAIHAPAQGRDAHRAEAAGLMQRALRSGGGDTFVLLNVATAGLELGEDTAAIAALVERAAALNPGAASVWEISARLQLTLGAADLAVQHLETVARLDPLCHNRFLHLSDLGAARLLQGRNGEAAAALRQAIQQRPGIPRNHALLAAALARQGQAGEARQALERFHALTPITTQQLAARLFRTPEAQAALLDGLALAEADGG